MGLLLAATILAAGEIATVPKNSPAYVCGIEGAVETRSEFLRENWV